MGSGQKRNLNEVSSSWNDLENLQVPQVPVGSRQVPDLGCPVTSGSASRIAPEGAPTGTRRHATQEPHRRIGRKPIPEVCRCTRIVLTAWDADMCALLVHLDPHALTPAGELWALQTGRSTYHLDHAGIHRRDRWNIPGKPPTVDRVVLATHICPDTTPDEHRLTRPKKPRPHTPDHIPF